MNRILRTGRKTFLHPASPGFERPTLPSLALHNQIVIHFPQEPQHSCHRCLFFLGFGLLFGCFVNLTMRKQTLVSSLTNPFQFERIGTRADANIHKTFAYSYLSNNICTVVEEWTHGYFLLLPRHTSTS